MHLWLLGVDIRNDVSQSLDLFALTGAKNAIEQGHKTLNPTFGGRA